MPTSCRTHDYDGELREKWFEMRPMLIEKYLPNCSSFNETINQIEQWLDRKYYNVKRIGRARRALRILTTQRRNNFDSRNDIDVEELLPILWNQVKDKDDLHDTFYEQLCDITGGSCSQGRSTRLFQFLFLCELPNTDESEKKNLPVTTIDVISPSNPTTVPERDDEASLSVEATPDEEEQNSSTIKQTDDESRMSTQENTEQLHESQAEQITSPSDE